jgi:GT2 family glycosyltransferase
MNALGPLASWQWPHKMPRPRVAVLLLNWNGWRDTVECLETVFRLQYENFIVVVCDNASTDDSVERLRDWASEQPTGIVGAFPQLASADHPIQRPVALIELTRKQAESGAPIPASARLVLVHNGDNLGFAAGNNVGLILLLAQADVEFAWILNNDVVVDPHSLTLLVDCARSDPRVGAVGATILEYREPSVIQAAGGGVFSKRYFNPRLITKPRTDTIVGTNIPTLDFISGACLLVRTDVLRSVGLIDESFFIYCEDVDLSVRIRERGFQLAHAGQARIWHKGGSAMGHRSPRHDYYTVRNTLALVRKHHPVMLPVIASYLVYRAILPKLVRGQRERLAAAWRGYRDFRNRVTGAVGV